MNRGQSLLLWLLLAPGWLGACTAERATGLTVFAAASSVDVLAELAAAYGEIPVRVCPGASSGLARQIADGAPADVFVSASRRWIDFLAARDLLRTAPCAIGGNRLVCVVPVASPLLESSIAGPAELVLHLAAGDRVAIADAGVPAGDYARQSLTATGALPRLAPHLVGLPDVRAALRAVVSGQAVAGFVYSTDAAGARGRVVELFRCAPGSHDPIELCAAALATGGEAAAAFVAFLGSDAARAILARAGFEPPSR